MIAIQVIFTRSARYAPPLLDSLKRQTQADWQLFVLENSCDASEAAAIRHALEASGMPYRLTVAEANLGFSGGHQLLFTQHAAEYVVLMNDDAYLDARYLEACFSHFQNCHTCASVQGLVYHWSCGPDRLQSVDGQTKIDTLGLEYHCLGDIRDRYAGQPLSAVPAGALRAQIIFGASGAVVMYRRNMIMSASPDGRLFDPAFFMYKEDVDLALRLKSQGYAAWFEPTAIAYHARSIKMHQAGFWARLYEERRRAPELRMIMYRNQWWLYRKYARASLGWNDWLGTLWQELKRSAALFFLGSPGLFFRAWLMILSK